MRLLLNLTPDQEPWVPLKDLPERYVAKDISLLFSQSLVLLVPETIETLRQAFRTTRPALEVIFISELLKTPRVTNLKNQSCDYEVKNPISVPEIEYDPKFLSAQSLRTSQGVIGEGREPFFSRTLGDLMRLGKETHLFDPYLAENLEKPHTGAYWVVWTQLAKLPLQVVLHSTIRKNPREPDLDYENRSFDKWNQLKETLRKDWIQSTKHPNFTLTVNLHEFNQKHDRFGRIVFERGHVNFETTKGLEIYRDQAIHEAFKVWPLNPVEYDARVTSWKSTFESFKLPTDL